MSFLEQRTSAEKFGAVFGFIAIAIMLRIFWNMGAFDGLIGRNTPEAIEASIQAELQNDPTFATMYSTMEREFPEEYASFKGEMVEAYQRNGRAPDAMIAGRAYMQRFMTNNAPYFAVAPDESINAMRDSSIRIIEYLSVQDTQLCANFAMTGLQPGDTPSLEVQQVIAEAVETKLEAIAAGRDMPVQRAEPDEADFVAYGEVLSNMGMSDARINDFFSGGYQLLRESPDAQCDAGATIYSAMAALPADRSARLGAILLNQ